MTDQFGRSITYLRLSVTERCNLRCRYCMPEEGVFKKAHSDMLTEEEMIQAVKAAASLGIQKLRITGGEPLVKKNIVSICKNCAAVPGIREVCITTNGILLPQYAADLKTAGVTRVNLSLDTLDAQKYASITRWSSLDDAMAGLHAALNAGFEKVKINAVLIGSFNDEEVPKLAELSLDAVAFPDSASPNELPKCVSDFFSGMSESEAQKFITICESIKGMQEKQKSQ